MTLPLIPSTGNVIGMGIDSIEIERICLVVKRHGDAFARRVLSDEEFLRWMQSRKSSTYLSARWAAKEAISKSLGCGISAQLRWHDMTVLNDASGRPLVETSHHANALLKSLGVNKILISITHTKTVASAAAIALG